ncbi:acid phosphatase [Paucibacter sp. R3-3]|uniref:phospholipase C n=1 Tax=Roseateles agri TaxID=3098619 RepID=A0ABU5DEC8_9BURK|nr:acid phosphatase [Paucibacter sp. R3-3]MDY0744105.1 acid phosphatase [Paucibacter sp. R3-3]
MKTSDDQDLQQPFDPERRRVLVGTLAAAGAGLLGVDAAAVAAAAAAEDRALRQRVKTIVVIYGENRSFNNLFAQFPGQAQPLADITRARAAQRDRDGAPLPQLPKIWGGLVPHKQTVDGTPYAIDESQIAGLPNAPFRLADAAGKPLPLGVITRDLTHRFYQNQMQINGGRNDQFVAWGDSGALVMGHYGPGSGSLKLAEVAKRYVLCDRFFMSAFGGSWMNHIFLISAQPPFVKDAKDGPVKRLICEVEGDDPKGTRLKLRKESPASALDGPPRFERDGTLTPDGYAVNTMAPPYQPSYVKPAPGGDPALADPRNPGVLPPQEDATIGDRLSAKGISWAWWSGAWAAALAHEGQQGDGEVPNFQEHHQPFNYYRNYAPGTAARAEHLRDAGLGDDPRTNHFLAAIDAGKLPAVSFYKPQGNLNMHAGYADVASGDAHIAHVIERLEKSPQWSDMVVIVTVDENGGWWDHVAPPEGDRWGPGSRIPAIVISPHAKKGVVDHTDMDTNAIIRLITRVHGLEPLPGVKRRDDAMRARGQVLLGDLTSALELG